MKVRKILLSLLILAISSVSAVHANESLAKNKIIPGKERLKYALSQKSRRDNLYYVVLKDSPLSTYQEVNVTSSVINTSSKSGVSKNVANVLNVHSAKSVQYQSYLAFKQESLLVRASRSLARKINAHQNYKIVLNAMLMELSSKEVDILALDQDVERIEKVGLHYIHTSSGPEFIGAKKVWQEAAKYTGNMGEGVVVGIIDTGITALHPSFADIGEDGYDHTNPLGTGNYLGDCIEYSKFCNDKLIGIVSYPEILDAYPNVANPNVDDAEDKVKVGYDFNGHGTHVASTAAGNVLKNVNYRLNVADDEGTIAGETAFNFPEISGVAPHANIVSYQVCNQHGSCFPELAILALEHAIENNVNVVNYSVGGGARDPWTNSDSEAFLNARAAGIHAAVAAGNAGPNAQTVGSPGNSPWVITAAAYSHDRTFTDKKLMGFSGGDSIPADISGKGATAAYTGKVIMASDLTCLEPFEEGTFNGEIVVCERGDIARVRKGLNVKAGGAGGLILINVDAEVDNIAADKHLLPAIHVTLEDGVKIVDWLFSGENHQATISGSTLTTDSELGDIAGPFTSRGPNYPYASVFTPDIAAPGVEIFAAHSSDKPFEADGESIDFVTYSGTSMASPHVAGALALIHSARPDWTPSQVQSAIMSTAHQLTYKDDDSDGNKERSDFFDQGAGSIRVDKAIKAGLLLHVSKQEYLDVAPLQGGNPAELNTSSVALIECITSCTWTRTVTATQDSSWTVNYEYLNPGFTMEASPASFSLKAGESQEITLTTSSNIDLRDDWVHGYVNFVNADTTMSDTHFQATIYFKAGAVVTNVEAELNNIDNQLVIKDVTTSGSDDLQVKGFGLYKSNLTTGSPIGAANDRERNSPALSYSTIFSQRLTVKPYTKRLIVEITDTAAPDMDLYVGIDEDNDGLPNSLEMYYSLVCISGNVDSNERCVIEKPPSGEYWIFVHNYEGTEAGQPDDVTVSITQITYTDEPSFDIEAPSAVEANELFDITLNVNGYLNDSADIAPLAKGEVYYGLVELGTTYALKSNIGATLLKVTGLEAVNTAPEVVAQPDNITVKLSSSGSAEISVDVSVVFTDAEQETLELSASGSDTATIEQGIVAATFDTVGTYTLIISASDGMLAASTSFDVIVLEAEAVNTAPEVVAQPDNITVKLSASGSAEISVDVSATFTDAEQETLELSVAGVDTATIDQGIVSATFDTVGTYTIIVTASDGVLMTSTSFDMTVNAADVVVTPTPTPEKSSGGGSMSWFILLLLYVPLMSRRSAN